MSIFFLIIFDFFYNILYNFAMNDLFLGNVECLVKERNISKQAFCDELGFSRSSFVNWKNQSYPPNGDTIIKISSYFKVDPKWLVTGEIDIPEKQTSWPSSIFERVYHLLLEETKTPNPDYHKISIQQAEYLWQPIEKIASCHDLINWQFNRIMPNYHQILELAEHFGKTISYIADGIEDLPAYLDPCKVPEDEYKDFKRFKAHKNFMYKFHSLSNDGMKVVDSLVDYIFNKEHKR